jgi:mono/diheme cytochrome c family protein
MKKNSSGIALLILTCFIIGEGCMNNKGDQDYPSSPTSSCDTTTVRYSVEIKSILDANCKGCHNGSNSLSGIDLYDHSTIAAYALDGKFTYGSLLSAVKHEGGAPEMPKGAPKLQDCDINKIAAWVHKGALNN